MACYRLPCSSRCVSCTLPNRFECFVLQDGNVITSAGVSAGMDMTLHLITLVMGPAEAKEVAEFAEYHGQWASGGLTPIMPVMMG